MDDPSIQTNRLLLRWFRIWTDLGHAAAELLLRTNYSDPIFIGIDRLPQRDPPKLLTLARHSASVANVRWSSANWTALSTVQRSKSAVITDEQAKISAANIGFTERPGLSIFVGMHPIIRCDLPAAPG
jgi:hypothetical protein